MQTIYQNSVNVGGRRSGSDRRVFADLNRRGIERRIAGNRREGTRNREHLRFRAKDLTFVKLVSGSDVDVAQMTDISKGGLSFRYFLDEKQPQDYSDLGIFMSDNDFAIDQILFETVSNTVSNSSQFSSIVMKRCGVQFKNLTAEQTSMLEYYLLNHTMGEA